LCNGLLNLHSLLKNAKMIKSRKIVCVGHVLSMREMKNLYRIFVGESERKRPHLGDSSLEASIDSRTIS
jgi:hypothetical protein